MIDEEQSRRLRESIDPAKFPDINDSMTAPLCVGDFGALLDTIDSLWKVARAVRRWDKATAGQEATKNYAEMMALVDALPPMPQ